MLDMSFAGAALAGLLSFFTPCILPMVPFYLCYMAGISMSELQGDGEIAPGAQKRLVLSSICFALGVTTIFVLLGLGATALGQACAQWKEPLSYVAAMVLDDAPPLGGGLPVFNGEGSIVAGIGVSGAPGPDLDEECAQAGIAAVEDQIAF